MTDPAAPHPDIARIERISTNARSAWFGLIALLVFVATTLLGHQDADFFAFGAATQLPLVGFSVPPERFFIAAPILVASVYIYLHLYLLTFWDAIGQAPARDGDHPLSDCIFPWLLAQSAVWYRNWCRHDRSAAPRALGGLMLAVNLAITWVGGLGVLLWLWIIGWAAHDEWSSLLSAACFWLALLVGWRGLTVARRHLKAKDQQAVAHGPDAVSTITLMTAALVLPHITWMKTEGWSGSALFDVPLARANLVESELTQRPADWLPFDEWKKEYRQTFAIRQSLPVGGDWGEIADDLFERELLDRWRSYTRSLPSLSLEGRDLRNATAESVFLAGADLRRIRADGAILVGAQMDGANLMGAQMDGAYLILAQMDGADLSFAQMDGANLSFAQMDGANLSYAQMDGANLREAQLYGADLSEAQMVGADLSEAQMDGADLSEAQMDGASLSGAQMDGADLSFAQMAGADLSGAQMDGADLSFAQMDGAVLFGAQMDGAVLFGAQMDGAVLRWAQMDGADLRGAQMDGAVLVGASFQSADLASWSNRRTLARSADFSGAKNMTADHVKAMFGDAGTVLPDGLHRPPDWDTRPVLHWRDPGFFEPTEDIAYQDWLKTRPPLPDGR